MEENKPIALFIFDYTGIMAQPWLDDGYECWLFDGQHEPGIHRQGDLVRVGIWFENNNRFANAMRILSMIDQNRVKFIFGFPECTDLAVSGARHFKKKSEADPGFQNKAMDMVYLIRDVGDAIGAAWGLENPVSVISSIWRKPDHSFDPYEFGGYLSPDDEHPLYPDHIEPQDAYPKKTCIWSGGGFAMPDKRPVQCDEGFSDQYNKLGGKSLKTKNIRSATPRGFAKAVWEFNGH